ATSPGPAARPASILLVEDEAPLRRLSARLLERAGHAVRAVDGGEAALAALEAGPLPDAVVSDVAMPGMDGLALAARIRERWPALPVLLVSGYAEGALGCDLGALGVRLLTKPYAPEALAATLAEMLGAEGR
ncbi:MAG TPA: response regulator, partial [Crenalkalicoccus sp.]|nr:response regulator [Crenalkalicoccus sp.]